MKEFFKKLVSKYLNPDVPLRKRICTVVGSIGFLLGLINVIILTVVNAPKESMFVTLLLIICCYVLVIISNATKRVNTSAAVACMMFNILVAPGLFLTGGGIYSGMQAWMVFGLVLTVLLIDGRSRYICFAVSTVWDVVIFIVMYLNPRIVIPLGGEQAVVADMIFSTIVVGISLAGALVYYEKVSKRDGSRANGEASESADRGEVNEELRNDLQRMYSKLAFELRGTVNNIAGLARLISKSPDDEVLREQAHTIEQTSEILVSMTQNILEYGKLLVGENDVKHTGFPLGVVLCSVYDKFADIAGEKNLAYKFSVAEHVPDRCIGDGRRLDQILCNVIGTAVRNTAFGSVRLEAESELLPDNIVELSFTVTDTAGGIDPLEADLYSNRLRRDKVYKDVIAKSNLFLSIASDMTRMVGGRTAVDTNPGRGTVFKIVVPVQAESMEPMGDFAEYYGRYKKEKIDLKESIVSPCGRVLVVDDDEMNLAIFSGLLKKTGVQITTCVSGEQAVSFVRKSTFDIIFLDYVMPKMNGLETLRTMMEDPLNRNLNAPVIVLTANSNGETRDTYLEMGFTDYLAKPINYTELNDMLLRYLPDDVTENKENNGDVIINEKELARIVSRPAEPLIDRATGLKYSGNDDSTYKEFLKIYGKFGERKLDDIKAAFLSRNWENYIALVHSLKSTSMGIGANTLSEEARRLEEAGRTADYDYIRDNNDKVLEMYRDVLFEVKNLVD